MKKTQSRNRKTYLALLGLLLSLMLTACSGNPTETPPENGMSTSKETLEITKQNQYDKADELLTQGEYEEAREIFASLDGFEDSAEKIKEADYRLGCKALDDGEWETAMEIFEALSGYKDSNDKLKGLDFHFAFNDLLHGETEAAREAFVALGDYEDAAKYVKAIDCIPFAEQVKTIIDLNWQVNWVLSVEGIEVSYEYSPIDYMFTMTQYMPEDGLAGSIAKLKLATGDISKEDSCSSEADMIDSAQYLYDTYFASSEYSDITCVAIRDEPVFDNWVSGSYSGSPITQSSQTGTKPGGSGNAPSSLGGDSYILPTDTQYITKSDLYGLPKEEVVLARNEIYARYGYSFQSENIRSYFESQSWYYADPSVNSSTFSESMLNDYERTNLETILSYEREMGWK